MALIEDSHGNDKLLQQMHIVLLLVQGIMKNLKIELEVGLPRLSQDMLEFIPNEADLGMILKQKKTKTKILGLKKVDVGIWNYLRHEKNKTATF